MKVRHVIKEELSGAGIVIYLMFQTFRTLFLFGMISFFPAYAFDFAELNSLSIIVLITTAPMVVYLSCTEIESGNLNWRNLCYDEVVSHEIIKPIKGLRL